MLPALYVYPSMVPLQVLRSAAATAQVDLGEVPPLGHIVQVFSAATTTGVTPAPEAEVVVAVCT